MRLALCLAAALVGASALAQPAADVPVERVILFTSGVGYFEHAGRVAGDADVTLRFEREALNDVLKSLVVEDRTGRVAGVVYPTQAPVERTLRSFAVDLSGAPDLAAVLRQVRGARVAVTTPTGTVRGTVLSVGTEPREAGGAAVSVDVLTLLTAGGLVSVRLDTAREIAFADPALQAELEAALAALAEAQDGDRKPVRVQFRGAGVRPVRLGYVVGAPVWKTSYRLVLPDRPALAGRPAPAEGALQGWALVENPTEADWDGVDLTLVSGRPVSFVTDLYSPRYVDRPVVTLDDDAIVRPQTYAAGARARGSSASARPGGAAGTVSGTVVDEAGRPLPGATVRAEGTPYGAATDAGGRFEFGGLSPGTYRVVVSFVGYAAVAQTVRLDGRGGVVLDVRLAPDGAALDEVVVSGMASDAAPLRTRRLSGGAPAAAPPPPLDPTAGVVAQAEAGDFGELFAYRLGRVTLGRRGSAMLPIVTGDVGAERLSVYSGGAGRHPMRGVRLVNTTGAALRAGPVTVLDDGYAGDAVLPDLGPGDERLLTFAVDQAVLVDPFALPDAPGTVEAATLRDGVLLIQRQTRTSRGYRLENRGDRARTVLVEHPRRSGARLLEPSAAEETTPERYRFRVELAAGAVDTLAVVEARLLDERVALTSISADRIAAYARADGALPADVRRALERAAADRRALAETEREIGALRQELSEIEREQDRIRGNLQAVDNGTDYGRRLLAKLDEQETRIEAIRQALERLEAEAARQRAALAVTVRP